MSVWRCLRRCSNRGRWTTKHSTTGGSNIYGKVTPKFMIMHNVCIYTVAIDLIIGARSRMKRTGKLDAYAAIMSKVSHPSIA